MSGRGHLNLLTVNTGSSSIKTAVYQVGKTEEPIIFASVDRIGSLESRTTITNANHEHVFEQQEPIANHGTALKTILGRLDGQIALTVLDAIGHRVVLGDKRCLEPQVLTERLLSTFNELTPLAPDHLPQVVDCISALKDTHPDVPQVACFDSTFHRQMPPEAQMYAIPRRLYEQGILRYGFHGLSCEYIMQALATLNDPVAAKGRVIIAHLGNGSSITAVQHGLSIDNSMGFTPLAGMVMGTRCGDLDPGVITHIADSEGLSPFALNNLLNRESGLLGVSGHSPDMRDLLDREFIDSHCAQAVAMFCYQARKFIGAYAAALGGLDALIFTGGIGEHAAVIRQRICSGMDFIGITLDPNANVSNAPIISVQGSHPTVRVIETNEDLIIARHTCRVIKGKSFREPT